MLKELLCKIFGHIWNEQTVICSHWKNPVFSYICKRCEEKQYYTSKGSHTNETEFFKSRSAGNGYRSYDDFSEEEKELVRKTKANVPPIIRNDVC